MLFKATNISTIKKYLRKICISIIVTIIITFLVVNWKFNIKLRKLNALKDTRIRIINNLISRSNLKERINNNWRTPDVKGAAIFSAYLDTRPEILTEELFYSSDEDTWALIRIISILEVGTENLDFSCYYKFVANDSKITVMELPAMAAKLVASQENFEMQYSAAFVLCKLITSENGHSLPKEITFSSTSGKTTEDLDEVDFVEISYPPPPDVLQSDRFMSACVPSLHHGYDNYENLIEFVEFYRMMGVDHFTFYNTSVTAKINQVLAYYEAKNLATVIQWKLPSRYKFERNLRYNGIYAALNDCLYRNTMLGGFTYIVNVDLDEFIVPRSHSNFRQMMNYLDPELENNNKAAFIFHNVFFYLMYDDDPTTLNQTDQPKLLLQSKTTRYEDIYVEYSRSKYIARGENVIEMGNHRIWLTKRTSLLFRTKEVIVDPEIALSQHYRLCEVNELVCWLRKTVVDTAAHKYTDELKRRVAAVIIDAYGKEDK